MSRADKHMETDQLFGEVSSHRHPNSLDVLNVDPFAAERVIDMGMCRFLGADGASMEAIAVRATNVSLVLGRSPS